jgi:DNA-binding Xre family transcriptional regulator
MADTRLTKLGKIFARKSVNQASISRRTGITKQKLTYLSTQSTDRILASEVYLIALAIDMDPGGLLDQLCNHLQVTPDTKVDGRKAKNKKAGK